jgi:SpoVK/Ycf46/Vps4 family AAA+-type ATPase
LPCKVVTFVSIEILLGGDVLPLPNKLFYGSNLQPVKPLPDPLSTLKVLIDSSAPIVVMETVEEVRAVRLVRVACASLNLASFEWSIASGLARCGNDGNEVMVEGRFTSAGTGRDATDLAAQTIYNTREPAQVLGVLEGISVDAAFILKDFHRHMEDPVVVRRLRDVGQKFSKNRRTVVIIAPSIKMPPELASLVEYLELPLPDKRRLRQIIDEMIVRVGKTRSLSRALDASGLDAMAANLRGLTEEQAERAVSQAIVTRYGLTAEIVTDVLQAKKDILRRSEMMDFVEVSDTLASVGGLENLKHWLEERRGTWEERARAFGLEPPRGVVILGVQGCGKSMCAQAIAGEWKLPLVKFDTAAIFDKYIGETEKRIQKVFQVAEELSPCVLWIDELEKVFAGSGSGSASADAGVSSRLLGAFLSWMQERKAPVFVAATCNDVSAMPPELIRKGRFDELFFVDLPNQRERKQIFTLELQRRNRLPSDFDLDKVAAAAQGYSGAEIQAAIQAGLYGSFSSNQALGTSSLLDALAKTVPLSTTRSEEIQELRDWARTRAVPASVPDAKGEGA